MVRNLSLASPRVGLCRRCEEAGQLGAFGYCPTCTTERALLLEAFFSKRPARLSASLPPIRPVLPRARAVGLPPRWLVLTGLLLLVALLLAR